MSLEGIGKCNAPSLGKIHGIGGYLSLFTYLVYLK
jgi:hypothetical protein